MSVLAGALDGLTRALWGLSVQVSVLIGLVFLVSLLFRKAPPTWRYALWCIVLVRLCIPASLSVPFGLMGDVRRPGQWLVARLQSPSASFTGAPPAVVAVRAPQAPAVATVEGRQAGAPPPPTPGPAPTRLDWRRALPLAWTLGVLGGAGLIAWRARRAARLVRGLPRVERPDIVSALERLCARVGVRRRVELRRGDSVLGEGGPMTLGILRPTVVLPQAMVEGWTLDEIEPVLTHELAHIRRLDLLVNWVQIGVQLVYFFHPLVWYANWRIRQERELICDDLAVGQMAAHRGTYCRSILRVLEDTRGNPWVIASGMGLGERRSSLGRRIMRIMDRGYRGHRRLGGLGVAWVVLSGIVCIAVASEKAPGTSPAAAGAPAASAGPGDTLDPETRRIGEEVRRRLTTYSDVQTFTLSDGQSAEMTLKPNEAGVTALRIKAHVVADGTVFDLRALDAAGRPLGDRDTTSPTIHDGDSERMATALGARTDVFSKIQLLPRRTGKQVTVEVKVLFARPPSPKETEAALLSKGKEGELHLAFGKLAEAVIRYKIAFGNYPARLDLLKTERPKDVYSPAGDDLHYQAERGRFILSSCGQDGLYGNDDDEVFVGTRESSRSGQRHELYPLPPDVGQAQSEQLGPSGRRPAGSCLLAGRVVDERTGQAVSHATVYLAYGDSNDPLFVSVGDDGGFELKSVACGAMSLVTIHTAGYQDLAYNPNGEAGVFPRFTLADKEERRDIVLKLKAANRISGRVLDENGQPVSEPGLLVVALGLPADPKVGAFRKQTNIQPDGTYLLDGLPAQPLLVEVQDFRAEQQDNPYPIRYYPGTFSRDEATRVAFDQKHEHDGVDIRLAKKGGLAVDGRITDAVSGAPIAEALVVVQYSDVLFDRVTSYTDATGRYHVEGLGPGAFLVQADARPQGFVRTKKPITLSTQAQTGTVDFTLHKGVTISGTIVNEDGSPAAVLGYRTSGTTRIKGSPDGRSVVMSGVRHRLEPASAAGDKLTYYGGEGEDRVSPMLFPSTNTFLVTGMAPGRTVIDLRTGASDRRVVRVMYQGQDVSESGIDTLTGGTIENVLIVIGQGAEPDR